MNARYCLKKTVSNQMGKPPNIQQLSISLSQIKSKGKNFKCCIVQLRKLVADFYTKPLQGSLFIKHRNTLLGIRSDDGPLYEKQYTDYINGLYKPEASV